MNPNILQSKAMQKATINKVVAIRSRGLNQRGKSYQTERPLLKKSDLMSMAKAFRLTGKQAAAIGGISVSTYHRWKTNHSLSTESSEHLLKVVEIYISGMKLFENDENSFINWMNATIPILNYRVPLEMMITSVNEANRIDDILNGIEYGVVF
jgi:putative toxin-antitoxin system antitoxin component (TIGR02293 family)